MREKLAEWFSYNLYCDHCPIGDCDWAGEGPCVWDYQKADSILAMLGAEGMVMQLQPQKLPQQCPDADGEMWDLDLEQIRLVKMMWKQGWRRVIPLRQEGE